jgi:predicted dithiol-disulfide oxidoreductase (DUF899 family)
MDHVVVSREAWLEERMALLRREKAVTRELDLLALERQKLPWVAVEKSYALETQDGTRSLEDLFGPYRQLIVYHFMFGPDWSSPCGGCTGWADAFNGTLDQIQLHDANLIAVSRAPIEKLSETREKKGWSFVWASSFKSDFSSDFHMSGPDDRSEAVIGDEVVSYDRGESGGINVFVKDDDKIFHSYSGHNRGIQQMNGAFGYVDLLPYGGN